MGSNQDPGKGINTSFVICKLGAMHDHLSNLGASQWVRLLTNGEFYPTSNKGASVIQQR